VGQKFIGQANFFQINLGLIEQNPPRAKTIPFFIGFKDEESA